MIIVYTCFLCLLVAAIIWWLFTFWKNKTSSIASFVDAYNEEASIMIESERILGDLERKIEYLARRTNRHLLKARAELDQLNLLLESDDFRSVQPTICKELEHISNDLGWLMLLDEDGFERALKSAGKEILSDSNTLEFKCDHTVEWRSEVKRTFAFRIALDLFRFTEEAGEPGVVIMNLSQHNSLSIEFLIESGDVDLSSEYFLRVQSRAEFMSGHVTVNYLGSNKVEVKVVL